MIRVKDSDELDWDVDWNGLQMLPGKVRATVQVRQYSNLLFNSRFQESFNRITSRTQRWTGSLDRDLKLATLTLRADRTTTFFGVDSNRVNSHLPEPGPAPLPPPGRAGAGSSSASTRRPSAWSGAPRSRWTRWARFDVAPTVSRPLRLSFLEVNPEVGYRFTRYGTSFGVDENDESGLFGDPLNRSFWEAQVGMRGPIFSRVFDTPGFGYSERFKHTIGPEVNWTYRTRVEDFNSIPKFDGRDYYLGTNQIPYALVQKFYSKRRGPGGKKVPYEFLSWRLQQTYYVQIADGQSNFDPNYSSSAFGPGATPEHLSPLMSRLQLPARRASSPLNFQVEYDVNFKQIRRTSTYGNWNAARFNLNGGWSRSVRLSEDPEERIVGSESLRGNGGLRGRPATASTLDGSASYDLKNKILWQLTGRLRYQVQCCGFVVEYNRFNWNGREEKQWRFNLELANIGCIGNFLGADSVAGGRQGFGGSR